MIDIYKDSTLKPSLDLTCQKSLFLSPRNDDLTMQAHSSTSPCTLSPLPSLSTIGSQLGTVETRLNTMETLLSNISTQLTDLTTRLPSPLPPPAPQPQPTPSRRVLKDSTAPAAFYKFNFYDACDNVLTLPDDPIQRPVFKITTTRTPSGGARERTVVKFLPSSASASAPDGGALTDEKQEEEKDLVPEGGIDWRKKKISVGEVSKSFKEVRRKIGKAMSL